MLRFFPFLARNDSFPFAYLTGGKRSVAAQVPQNRYSGYFKSDNCKGDYCNTIKYLSLSSVCACVLGGGEGEGGTEDLFQNLCMKNTNANLSLNQKTHRREPEENLDLVEILCKPTEDHTGIHTGKIT